ncbi:MerR family transcriptional regulator [Flavisolibacter sp. BT320]|nr:MerR family transcriptional regulator [Flavisolibacter longurius]
MFQLSRVFPVSEKEVYELAEALLQKDYTTEALSYIKNPSRTLNYWGEGEENLLPGESPGHHRFSFQDLVWLGIVKELRDLGMSKRTLFQLKQELMVPVNAGFVYDKLLNNRKELETYMLEKGGSKKDVHDFLDFLLQNKETFLKEKQTLLMNHIYDVVIRKTSLYLLINKEGHHEVLYSEEFRRGEYDRAFEAFFNAPHLSIHLNSILGFFLSKDYIQDSLKETVLTKDEWKIIQTIRKEKPDSIEVKFSVEGKVESLEVTKLKKVQIEARLIEIIAAGGFETITIKTQNGKPVYLKKQKKIK